MPDVRPKGAGEGGEEATNRVMGVAWGTAMHDMWDDDTGVYDISRGG